MDATHFIHLRSKKFPILPGEEEELVNVGTYGKALATWLEAQLAARGYEIPFVCCEDWGWWVEVAGQPFALGLCVYGSPDLARDHELCVSVSERPGRKWSWRRFAFVDTAPRVQRLFEDVHALLVADREVELLGMPEAYPLG